jgi:hypothetical protein
MTREASKKLQDALDGDRTAALAFWKIIANTNGDLTGEERLFVVEAARRIVRADATSGRRRADAMLDAVRLAGREDRHRELRYLVQAWREMPNLDDPDGRGDNLSMLMAEVRRRGLVAVDMHDDDLRALLYRVT